MQAGLNHEETRDPGKGTQRVFAALRERLLAGDLKSGERLPPERELALSLGVSRPILREALQSLAMLGFLEIRHGSGAYVRNPDITTLGDFLTFCMAQQPDVLDDVIQARLRKHRNGCAHRQR